MNQVTNLPLWLVEDATWPVLWGILFAAIFGFVWYVCRNISFLGLSAFVLLCVIGVLIVEKRVVTDEEFLVDAVYEMADHLRNNNTDGILKFVRDDNAKLRERIRNDISHCQVTSCSIVGFRSVDMSPPDLFPRSARLGFTVWGAGMYDGQPHQGAVAVELLFENRTHCWTLEGYGYQPSNVTGEVRVTQ